MEIDNTLYNFFESSECKDYLFCHRWVHIAEVVLFSEVKNCTNAMGKRPQKASFVRRLSSSWRVLSLYTLLLRWLLLDFKREFALEESIRIFEVLSSHYLELNSDKALVETDKVIAKEFELDGKRIGFLLFFL